MRQQRLLLHAHEQPASVTVLHAQHQQPTNPIASLCVCISHGEMFSVLFVAHLHCHILLSTFVCPHVRAMVTVCIGGETRLNFNVHIVCVFVCANDSN